MMRENEKIRLDKYLWAIHIFKTRSLAAAACHAGKIKLEGKNTKASHPVHVGDIYEIKTEARQWRIEIVALLQKRVAAKLAIQYYNDITPAAEKQSIPYKASSFYTGKKQSKIGRPTKKERRDLDNLFNQ